MPNHEVEVLPVGFLNFGPAAAAAADQYAEPVVLKLNLLLLAYERWRLLTTKNLFLDQSVYDRQMRQ